MRKLNVCISKEIATQLFTFMVPKMRMTATRLFEVSMTGRPVGENWSPELTQSSCQYSCFHQHRHEIRQSLILLHIAHKTDNKTSKLKEHTRLL